jgi:uncharacterized delta-60 repeat protein
MNNPPFLLLRLSRSTFALGLLVLVLLLALFRYHERVGAQGSAGSLSFGQSNVSVAENGGSAAITLTRTGGSSGRVTARVGLTDITTSPPDYVFKPGSPDLGFPAQQFNFSFFGTQSIALQRDGKIILAPSRVRLNADGSVDSTFNAPSFNSLAHGAAVQADGKILFIGGFTTVGGVRKNGVVRLNSDGSLDLSFDVGAGTSNANVIAFQSDGKILIGGIFPDFGGAPNSQYVVRLNTDGSLDSTFVKGTNVSSTYSLAVQPDGKILMGGWGLARLNPDGSFDNSFNCQLSAVILSLVLQPDGKILAGGNFDHFGSQAIYNIARINADGSLDTSFNTGSGPDSSVSTIALQPDGRIVIGGSFDSINGAFRSKIARLNSDGILDTSFDGIGSVSGTRVEALLMQDDGKLMASGFFSFTTTPVNYKMVARFNGDLFATWNDGDSANKTINLPIVDDSLQESNETLNLALTPLSGGASPGAIPNATLTINDNDVAPAFTSGPPPQGITKTAYSHMFTATGVPAPTFNLTSGTLPPGLFLQSSGLLSGTPTAAGTFSGITVTASNGIAPPATQTLSITILSGGIIQFGSPAYSVAENAGPIVVTVTRTGGAAGATGVSYNTNGGTAGSNSDFTQTTGTLTFAEGETSKTLSVPIINDGSDENDETFSVTLNSVTGSGSLGPPTTSTITIQDDDPPPTVTISDSVQLEPNSGTRAIFFAIRFSAPSGKTISFNYATTDGTASAGTDFVGASGNAVVTAGTMVFSLPLTITGDTAVEPDEIFTLTLTNPQNATLARATATGTIIGDDNGAANPIDLQGFLVFLHYSDFLGRAPDADGFNFWKGTITQCGSNAGCIEVQRIAASASFFLSIEFKETGYLVERIYKTSFGDVTGNSTFPSAHQIQVPVVRLNEFVTDTTTIGQGVVVLQPGWEQALETNKQTFLNNFVQRTRFLLDYPTNMTAASFVDKLNLRAGNPLSPSERDQLVNDLSTSAKTRAQVLRAVAEHQNLINAEFNRAFVLMQYFGYLRRNPNDSPDGDYTGYDFWLTKLNQFNGNYIAAEMVKAFLSSVEYRKRFGP